MTGRMTSESYFDISSLQSPVRSLRSLLWTLCAKRVPPTPFLQICSLRFAICSLPAALCHLLSALCYWLWTLDFFSLDFRAYCYLPSASCSLLLALNPGLSALSSRWSVVCGPVVLWSVSYQELPAVFCLLLAASCLLPPEADQP